MTGAAQVAEVIDVIGRFAADLRRLGPANFFIAMVMRYSLTLIDVSTR